MKQCELIKNESLSVNFNQRENCPECAKICANSNFDSCWANSSTDALNRKAHTKFEVAFQTLLSVANTTVG